MKDVEVQLMKLETRLDRIQNEARKALGECRQALEYHKKHKQQTLKRHIKHRYRTDGWKK